MIGRRVSLIAAVVGAVAACAAPPAPTPQPEGPKQCDAKAAQSLIGSHVGAVDFAPGANVRIVCTTCATTRDYRVDRLNVRFDEASGIIKAVDCG